ETSGLLRGKCDPHRIALALTNLLSNAVTHGNRNAPITITAHGSAGHCVISVHNAGAVEPEGRTATMFEPAHADNDRRHLGLGLYIVNKIMTAHGGRASFESSAEAGTTAAIHLPL